MDVHKLARIDLNLLVALRVMMEERNVSRAAERLYITQPAMSKTLSRLRELFDDPLFTRTSHGMLPTPRAEALMQPLACWLQDAQALIAPPEFDPVSYRGTFNLATSEHLGLLILPALMDTLQKEAPHIHINVLSRAEHQLELLAEGKLDWALQIEHSNYPDEFLVSQLGNMPPTMLAREDHPLAMLEAAGNKLTWEDIARYPQVALYIPDLEELQFFRQDNAFTRMMPNIERVLETSHLLTALEVIRRTDCLLPGPAFLVSLPSASHDITTITFPEDLDLCIRYLLVSHKRTETSLVHNWVREKIKAIVEKI